MNFKALMTTVAIGLSSLTIAGCVSETATYDDGYRRGPVYSSGVYYERDSYRDRYRTDRGPRYDRRDNDRSDRYDRARPDDRSAGRPYRGDRDRVSAACVARPDCIAGNRVERVDEYRSGRNSIELR